MSDISVAAVDTYTTLKQKNNSESTDMLIPNKKIRLDNTTEYCSDEQTPASSSTDPPKSNDLDILPPSPPQSEQTASTSSSLTSSMKFDWTNLFKDTTIPIPYNDFQNPRQLLSHLVPSIDIQKLPNNLDDFDICRLIYQIMASGSGEASSSGIMSEMFLIQREKLKEYNTIEQCVDLIAKSENILVLTGAGCSVSCGIPDFRSRDGVYARLRVDFPDLPDPQAMFDIFYFDHDPRPFFKFAKEIYPGQFQPSLSHMFIKKLEDNQKLLRNYTQNIDTLEMTAEIKKVIQCHGSFATATCTTCKYKVDAEHIREKILSQEIPYCEKCKHTEPTQTSPQPTEAAATSNENNEQPAESSLVYKKNNSAGILKPDIVFFGEGLPDHYHKSIGEDKDKCDLLIVIGSSLKVKPVANIPHLLPQTVPQILINRESLKHLNFDVELLGDCDVIVNEILLRLEEKSRELSGSSVSNNWSNICNTQQLLKEISDVEAEQILFSNQLDDQSESSNSSPDTSTVIIQNQKISVENEATNSEAPKVSDQATSDEMSMNRKKYTKDYLKDGSFLYLKPNMYVFHGAEIQLKTARKKLNRLKKKFGEGEGELDEEFDEESSESDEDDDDSDDSDSDDDLSDETDADETECQTEEDTQTSNIADQNDQITSELNSNEDYPDHFHPSHSKNDLAELLGNDFSDEEDDEDFTPTAILSKKKLTGLLTDQIIERSLSKKPE